MNAGLGALWFERARVLREQERMIEATAALAAARVLAPADPRIGFLHAQARYELGLPAAAHFAAVADAAPTWREARRNQALALASEGQPEAAIAVLEAMLARQPDWLDGQRLLAGLRWTLGDAGGYDAGFRVAVAALPHHPGLWLGWFSVVAQQRDWPRATAILNAAEAQLGETPALLAARVFVAGESGDLAGCEAWLARVEAREDPFLILARIRLALRRGEPAQALAIALPRATGALASHPLAGQMWPYIGTCWRLLGDARAGWLDGEPPYIGVHTIALSAAELAELGAVLRALHTARAAYAEQSVRGGTQTDRSVLLRHEPILRRTRIALMAAVRDFVASLPPPDATHPLLSRRRDRLRLSGSWSVRLRAGGYNVTHSHPMGWLSSAFYVAVPDTGEENPSPAGHLQLGAPPAELGLALAPYATIAPEPGRLVLFASTLWHGTYPITAGERLAIAFDVVPG